MKGLDKYGLIIMDDINEKSSPEDKTRAMRFLNKTLKKRKYNDNPPIRIHENQLPTLMNIK